MREAGRGRKRASTLEGPPLLDLPPEQRDWLAAERAARQAGRCRIAGIDEAGRGALAGPVVAACVVLPESCVPPGIDDSKALTPTQRERMFAHLQALSVGIGVGVVEAERIDALNILRATHEAMHLALENLSPLLCPDYALIDGLPLRTFPIPYAALVRGDARSASIAAASIVAKVTRDRLMCACDAQYPGYGFAAHKGYGVPAHLRALAALGPCPLHRRSYRPVRECSPRTFGF